MYATSIPITLHYVHNIYIYIYILVCALGQDGKRHIMELLASPDLGSLAMDPGFLLLVFLYC